ncbi:MAG TPA: DUF4097 family beta strand repeat-containing protein [Streptomyces sp.]
MTTPPAAAGTPVGRPRSHRAWWLAVAALTGALLATTLGSDAWALVNRHTSRHSYVLPHPVRTVEVYAGSGSVSVSTGVARQVGVRERTVWSTTRPVVLKTWIGDTLQLRSGCTDSHFFLLQALGCQVSLDVTVPADATVLVSTLSGSVQVRGVTGDVNIRTLSGSTHLEGLRGDVAARTDSGEISADALLSGDVTAQAGSGTVQLDFATAPDRVSAVVGSGSADVVVPRGRRYKVGGQTGSGSRDIDPVIRDGTATRTIDVSSGSGSVSVRYP